MELRKLLKDDKLLEEYRGYLIIKTGETIQTISPDGCRFIVCMDDSKRCGYRTFDESCNNVETARKQINWNFEPQGV